jgi:4-hydroxy-4-methyl-2-oxoglutarate aldolase
MVSLGEDRIAQFAGRFEAVYTAAITDVLDRMNLMTQTFPSELLPLQPGMRLAGPAFPVEGRPHPGMGYESSIRKTLQMLGEIPGGHVAVYQTHGSTAAHFGELSVVSVKTRGCVGAVIDGGCRDVDYIIREGFPVFCRHTTPEDCTPRWEIEAWGHEVKVGDVRVRNGDYVVADSDGIVVIPAEVIEQVLVAAEEVATTENLVREVVREGMLPLAAYERFGKF